MMPRCLNINSAADAAFVAIGVMTISLLAISACSKPVEPLAPFTTPSRSELTTPADESHEKIELRGVQFLGNGAIRPNSTAVLDTAVELLKDKPDVTIYVDAYCDPAGGPKLNQRLSQARAAAVASYLEEHGVATAHVIPRGFGANHFVATNTTAAGRSQNRRVELLVRSNSRTDDERAEDGKYTENYAAR
jgi:hypothetical protein